MEAADVNLQRKTLAMLKVLEAAGRPMGSAALSRALYDWGIDLRERMVRNYLARTDAAGLTVNLGRRGRTITELGQRELRLGVAIDRVGFVANRVDELAYRMTFDGREEAGTVIVNCTLVRTNLPLHEVLWEIRAVFDAQLGMGRRLMVLTREPNPLHIAIPPGHFALATVCSVTLNGIMLRRGIAMTSRFGGLLEMEQARPVRFRHLISYDGSTLDPLEVFIKGKMTSVRKTARTGTGVIGASFREIPQVALADAMAVVRGLTRVGLGGVLLVGKPNQPLLDVPVSPGRVGMVVAGGLNAIAALEEIGLSTESTALHSLCEMRRLQGIEELLRGA